MLTDPASIIVSSENQFSVTCCVLGLDSMQYQLTLSKTNRATDLTESKLSRPGLSVCVCVCVQCDSVVWALSPKSCFYMY